MKTIALIAHDGKKSELTDWAKENLQTLKRFNLCGTGTTAGVITKNTGLVVSPFLSGPLGGDQQVGAQIAEGKVHMLIFFWDALTAQPHDPDVKALLRIAALYNIPVATNKATADLIVNSPLI